MKKQKLAAAMAAVVAIAGAATLTWNRSTDRGGENTHPERIDPVLASFERELSHRPAPPPRVQRNAVENDLLYRAMNEIHWTPDTGPESVGDRVDQRHDAAQLPKQNNSDQ